MSVPQEKQRHHQQFQLWNLESVKKHEHLEADLGSSKEKQLGIQEEKGISPAGHACPRPTLKRSTAQVPPKMT